MLKNSDTLRKIYQLKEPIKPGDMLGFSSFDWSGFLINVGSIGVPFIDLSHIGIVSEYNDNLVLFESTTLCPLPCLVQQKRVSGAQVHSISDRVKSYKGFVYHIPLTRALTRLQQIDLHCFLMDDVGKPYDYLGAFRSGGNVFAWAESLFRPEDLNNIFCSEWVAAALEEARSFYSSSSSKWNPNSLYRELRRRDICQRRYSLKTW